MKRPVAFPKDKLVVDADAVVYVEDSGTDKVSMYCAGWDYPCRVTGTFDEVLAKLGIVLPAESEGV